MKIIDVVVVIPTPASHFDILLDVIDSIEFYIKRSFLVMVIDDSGCGEVKRRLEEMPLKDHISVICNDIPLGKKGGLFISFARAYKYCVENFSFKILIRMDTDALVTGYHLDVEAIEYFDKNPSTGIIGSYNIKSDGTHRKWWQWALVLIYESNPLIYLLGKKRLWHQEITNAKINGYHLGENVFGGACILSQKCISAMKKNGYLDLEPRTLLEEDVIFSLLAKASGYCFADFGKPDQSMSLGMYTLPIPKEEIISKGKKLIHSVKKGLNGETQQELRHYFKKFRSE